MKVYIAADHQGVKMKDMLTEFLESKQIDVRGVDIENSPTDDYPDFAFKVGENVVKENALGILICGNGIGMSIAANKVKGVRAARVLDEDDAFKCKNHNGANVISLSSKIDDEKTQKIVETFLFTNFPAVPKYIARVEKMDKYNV